MGKINATSVTIQAALFSVLSTTIAQCIAAWRNKLVAFQSSSYLTFAAIAIITTPPNYFYQKWLENAFPTEVPNNKRQGADFSNNPGQNHLSKTNAITKLLLDQTFGAAANTAAYIALMSISRGSSLHQIGVDIWNDFLDLLFAGWRVWPFVTMINLCVVPWEWRPAVGNTAGICWGAYLAIGGLIG